MVESFPREAKVCRIKKLGIKSPLSAVSEVPGKSFRKSS